MAAGRVPPSTLLGVAAAIFFANLVGIAFAPGLLKHAPLALIALSPLGRHLVLAATVTAIVPFVAVASARRMLVSALSYMLGRAYGSPGIGWVKTRYPKLEPLLGGVEWLFARAAPLLLFVAPGPLVCALAGATGMRAWLAMPIAAAGQTAWMILTYKLGEALAEWLAPIVAFIETYMVPLTLASIALALGYYWLRRRRQLSAMHALSGGPQELGAEGGAPAASSERPGP
jgi:membrane protein DedA with SNARE-associated domain